MTIDERLIRRVVADVLARVGMPPTEQQGPTATSSGDPIVLSEKVITESVLATRIDQAENIIIMERAILTPSAKDFLREHGIAWRREPAHPNSKQEQTNSRKRRWQLITTANESPFLEEIDKISDAQWSKESVSQTLEAVSRAVSCLRRGEAEGVVVFSHQPHRVACQCNRNENVRAGVADDVRSIDSLRQQVGANLIAIDPNGKTYFQLRNLLKAATRKGCPIAPTAWNDRALHSEPLQIRKTRHANC